MSDTFVVEIKQMDGEGNVLSVMPLTYPNLGNTLANAMQFDIIDGIEGVMRKYAVAKAIAVRDGLEMNELALLEHGIDGILAQLGR